MEGGGEQEGGGGLGAEGAFVAVGGREWLVRVSREGGNGGAKEGGEQEVTEEAEGEDCDGEGVAAVAGVAAEEVGDGFGVVFFR